MKWNLKPTNCARCNRRAEILEGFKRGIFHRYATRTDTEFGLFIVDAAELIIRRAPREPKIISARSLDNHFRSSPWTVKERHLAHVDNSAPGIMATLTHAGRRRLFLIEGYHRAENHRRSREPWACYVLTPEETYCLLIPSMKNQRSKR